MREGAQHAVPETTPKGKKTTSTKTPSTHPNAVAAQHAVPVQ